MIGALHSALSVRVVFTYHHFVIGAECSAVITLEHAMIPVAVVNFNAFAVVVFTICLSVPFVVLSVEALASELGVWPSLLGHNVASLLDAAIFEAVGVLAVVHAVPVVVLAVEALR
eukprot:COSAG01_NODE_12906_length_1668_cov_2.025526_2_plen_116_part_00